VSGKTRAAALAEAEKWQKRLLHRLRREMGTKEALEKVAQAVAEKTAKESA
jgi:hypothetical protein